MLLEAYNAKKKNKGTLDGTILKRNKLSKIVHPKGRMDSESSFISGEGKIFAYARGPATSLQAQVESIANYVNENIFSNMSSTGCSGSGDQNEIRSLFVDDGVSGLTSPENRLGLRSLMKAVEEASRTFSGKIHVVAHDASRLTRSATVGYDLKTFFEGVGATLHFAH